MKMDDVGYVPSEVRSASEVITKWNFTEEGIVVFFFNPPFQIKFLIKKCTITNEKFLWLRSTPSASKYFAHSPQSNKFL